jgi:hypothetical protein
LPNFIKLELAKAGVRERVVYSKNSLLYGQGVGNMIL